MFNKMYLLVSTQFHWNLVLSSLVVAGQHLTVARIMKTYLARNEYLRVLGYLRNTPVLLILFHCIINIFRELAQRNVLILVVDVPDCNFLQYSLTPLRFLRLNTREISVASNTHLKRIELINLSKVAVRFQAQ